MPDSALETTTDTREMREAFGRLEDENEKNYKTDWGRLREYSYQTLIRSLVKDYDNGFVPSLDQAEALFCQWMHLKDEPEREDDNLPWPKGFETKNESGGLISDGMNANWDDGKLEIANSKILGEITEEDGYDEHNFALRKMIFHLYERLDEKDIALVSKYIVDNLPVFIDCMEDAANDVWTVQSLSLEMVKWDSEYARELGDSLVDLMGKIVDSGKLDLHDGGGEWQFVYGMGIGTPEHIGMRQMIYRSLASNKEIDMEKKTKVLGLCLENFGFATELNSLREMMVDERIPAEERENVKEFLRQLLNLPEGADVHKSLEECYRAMEFDKYPVSEFTKPIRKEFLEKLIKEKGINKDAQVLDVATGTGWLVGLMRNELGLRNVWGADINTDHLEQARKTYGDYFSIFAWDKLPFGSDHFTLLTCLGRSLPHSENSYHFNKAIEEMVRVVEKDGTFVFDSPNPDIGSYKEGVERNRETMMKMGCSREFADKTYVIVDGPKGEEEKGNFYNRYVPSREMIERELQILGLEFEVIEEDIPNEKGEPSGDKNMVFICKKKHSDLEKEEEVRKDRLEHEKFKIKMEKLFGV